MHAHMCTRACVCVGGGAVTWVQCGCTSHLCWHSGQQFNSMDMI